MDSLLTCTTALKRLFEEHHYTIHIDNRSSFQAVQFGICVLWSLGWRKLRRSKTVLKHQYEHVNIQPQTLWQIMSILHWSILQLNTCPVFEVLNATTYNYTKTSICSFLTSSLCSFNLLYYDWRQLSKSQKQSLWSSPCEQPSLNRGDGLRCQESSAKNPDFLYKISFRF